MADAKKFGTDWQDNELDDVVADYFDMLMDELRGRPYVKSRHSALLMARIGRTHHSVEFKHQNISAVLDELGIPWIPGYSPKRNYQDALIGAVGRYLTNHPHVLDAFRPPSAGPEASAKIFVEAPAGSERTQNIPKPLQRLVRKFDPVERDHRNRSLGKAGEKFVVEVEKHQLTAARRRDLARKVRWVAVEDGDGAGYDVLSFDLSGRERLLEVKTTNGSARTPFFLSRNECSLAAERPQDWLIYRVHLFSKQPRIFTIAPPLEKALKLRPESWRASF
ncbi:MAG TPA: DUF3883 domain-containing protein [Terriglobales bacterium]|nr:DUF3883 domain-containing protein [Terriglobales bacterium]